MEREYILDSASELGRQQLEHLEARFDPITTACLAGTGIQPGWRCLDLGAGAGSITRWLAERAGPTGHVISVDIDTEHLLEQPGVEVLRHDITDGVPPGGPFDLIHARALLCHLPERERVFDALISALAPGGWLVLGECSNRPQRVLAAPSAADEALVTRVTDIAVKLVRDAGGSWEWAHEAEAQMAAAGLANIHGVEYCRTMAGGTMECVLNGNYFKQVEPRLLDMGITKEELERVHELMLDPGFRAWPWLQLVHTRGQKPVVAGS